MEDNLHLHGIVFRQAEIRIVQIKQRGALCPRQGQRTHSAPAQSGTNRVWANLRRPPVGSERPEKEPVALYQWRTGSSPGKKFRRRCGQPKQSASVLGARGGNTARGACVNPYGCNAASTIEVAFNSSAPAGAGFPPSIHHISRFEPHGGSQAKAGLVPAVRSPRSDIDNSNQKNYFINRIRTQLNSGPAFRQDNYD